LPTGFSTKLKTIEYSGLRRIYNHIRPQEVEFRFLIQSDGGVCNDMLRLDVSVANLPQWLSDSK